MLGHCAQCKLSWSTVLRRWTLQRMCIGACWHHLTALSTSSVRCPKLCEILVRICPNRLRLFGTVSIAVSLCFHHLNIPVCCSSHLLHPLFNLSAFLHVSLLSSSVHFYLSQLRALLLLLLLLCVFFHVSYSPPCNAHVRFKWPSAFERERNRLGLQKRCYFEKYG